MKYSKNQQLAHEAEARMLQALANSDAAQHLATPLLLNAAQTVDSKLLKCVSQVL